MRNQRSDSKNIKGIRFGKLTTMYEVRQCGKRGTYWQCLCDCGNETLAYGGHLRTGRRVSCGCKAEDHIEKSGFVRLYRLYKQKADKRNKSFNISLELFSKLVKGDCFYCGMVASQILERLKTSKIQIVYNGIDRQDPSIGYEDFNCVSCCKRCNFSKGNMTYIDWIEHLKSIMRFQRISL